MMLNKIMCSIWKKLLLYFVHCTQWRGSILRPAHSQSLERNATVSAVDKFWERHRIDGS